MNPSIEASDATPGPVTKITAAHIDALFNSCVFSDTKVGCKTTVVCAILPNGFEVIENSSCVDPANYNHAMGVEVCKRRLKDRLWLLEGYALQCRLHKSLA